MLEGQRVFFVAPGSPLLGSPETRHPLGKLQVQIYAGPTDAVLANLRTDLANASGGRVDPTLSDHYQLLSLLDKDRPATPGTPSIREWRLLARLCRTQTARFRSMPEQMRDHENAAGKGHQAAPAEPVESDN